MLFVLLAFGLPVLVVGAALLLPSTRRHWVDGNLRRRLSIVLIATGAILILSSMAHLVMALTAKCEQHDCAMGLALGVGLFLPAGLLALCSGVLLRARPIIAIVGHAALVLVAVDFALWATSIGYDSVIPWSN